MPIRRSSKQRSNGSTSGANRSAGSETGVGSGSEAPTFTVAELEALRKAPLQLSKLSPKQQEAVSFMQQLMEDSDAACLSLERSGSATTFKVFGTPREEIPNHGTATPSRAKKKGVGRQMQRLGHFITNDHPAYTAPAQKPEFMSTVGVEDRPDAAEPVPVPKVSSQTSFFSVCCPCLRGRAEYERLS